ncbi:DUF5682 family protein [Shewanella submarina]|uniref:DUF5682 family protein n=1 Tax=Shewanella submarina TaxID=2016376 RepID=A0ABV7GDW5_9GAMM|nr:DUF5682 family protein [Shewanella submarina]MCL1038052.1 DUF5682 family protein [Shewanella submarina]
MTDIHYLGIRHHGPGSTKRLLAALESIQPVALLIEGPADCTELLSFLGSEQMVPPVSLLSFATRESGFSIYYPFADYSPELQASKWAIANEVEVRFIDLPVSIQLADMLKQQAESEDEQPEPTIEADNKAHQSPPIEQSEQARAAAEHFRRDPIAALAAIAGYEDGEAWWNDVLEQGNDADTGVFDALADAMEALRDCWPEKHEKQALKEAQREAYMRLQIASASRELEGPIVVICGAWHLPALQQKVTQKSDRALLKSLPNKLPASQYKSTWIPWTSPRLAYQSGYGAGVSAPMWYQHIWDKGSDDTALAQWLTRIADMLRQQGQLVSTASVIEAVRLCHTLAAVRGRPSPGFEETRDAAISVLCGGEQLLWQQIEKPLLLGSQVGSVPSQVPLAPLLDDLQKWQKKTRLKSEALPREVSLDLRSEPGQLKSWLLHRLRLLQVPWGEQLDVGSSRGTFREKWQLAWEPEYSVQLVENQIYGSTLEEASANRTIQAMKEQHALGKLAALVLVSLEAQLPDAAEAGFTLLSERAAHTAEGMELLDGLPPLVDISRYGTSRDISLSHVQALIERLTIQAALSLSLAVRQLSEEESTHYRQALQTAHNQLELAQLDDEIMSTWWQAIEEVTHSDLCDFGVRGLCCRLMYLSQGIDAAALQMLMQRILSPAVDLTDAKRFFEGFFTGAAERLLYDAKLRSVVDLWLMGLDEQTFTESLPLLRRVFADLDAMERKRLLDALVSKQAAAETSLAINPDILPRWRSHMQGIKALLGGDKSWMN